MNITIYRYKLSRANWDWEFVKSELLENIANDLRTLPFYGNDEESQFGFTNIRLKEDIIIGLFIQKYLEIIINYHSETKAEIKEAVINAGEYFFALDILTRTLYLQAKRSKDLPKRKEINKRFRDQLLLVLDRYNLYFDEIEETKDETNREKIVDIFYNVSDRVIELDLKDFDRTVIEQEKRKRNGVRQKYFNPIEEYQEAMEEGAIRLSLNAESMSIKAKKGGSLKKDPISRAALEASRKPVKIVYEKENITRTEFGVIESKKTLTIEDESFDLSDPAQLALLMNNIGFADPSNILMPKKLNDLFNQR